MTDLSASPLLVALVQSATYLPFFFLAVPAGALADIVDGLGGRAANVHFEDRVENGEIHFDYIMQPGVVRKSNAIELMRSVGLKI